MITDRSYMFDLLGFDRMHRGIQLTDLTKHKWTTLKMLHLQTVEEFIRERRTEK